jgi:GNAT superfamily N-acetyltransferase
VTAAETELEWNPVTSRAPIGIEIVETGWGPWYSVFKVHHYLTDAKQMPFSTAYTGFCTDSGDPVAFMGMSGMFVGGRRVARACRMVVHPEWQGAGVGLRFLNTLVERERRGDGFIGAPVPSYMHTAHPALCAALRRSPLWTQVSQKLVGDEIGGPNEMQAKNMRFGGHLRSVAGFRYDGPGEDK